MGTTKVLFFLSRHDRIETSEHATPRLLSTVLRNTYTRTPPLLRRLPFACIVFAISRDKRTRPQPQRRRAWCHESPLPLVLLKLQPFPPYLESARHSKLSYVIFHQNAICNFPSKLVDSHYRDRRSNYPILGIFACFSKYGIESDIEIYRLLSPRRVY